jgi:hypothetical protein
VFGKSAQHLVLALVAGAGGFGRKERHVSVSGLVSVFLQEFGDQPPARVVVSTPAQKDSQVANFIGR